MKRGQITIFLSLLLSAVCGLLLVVIESTRVNAMRMQMEAGMDLGLHSVLAEYNRTLLSRYDLFYIDTSYRQGEADPGRMMAHLQDYMDVNVKPQTTMRGLSGDWFCMSVEKAELKQFLLATDYDGKAFERQAFHYVRQNQIGIGQESGRAIRNQMKEINLPEGRSEAESRITGISVPEAVSLMNALRGSKAVNLTTGFLPVSDRTIPLASTVSHRSLQRGTGSPMFREEITGEEADDLLERYIFDKYSDFTESKGQGVLEYEIEYILSGKDSDRENLEQFLSGLLRRREAVNVSYLFSDQAKVEEARRMALLLTAGLKIPGLTEAVTKALLYAWGYAEAILDVNRLLCGGRVPAVKDAADWRLPLKDILKYRSYFGRGGGSGYSYRDYLKAELAGAGTQKRIRCLDIIEANVRYIDQNQSFRADGCIEYVASDLQVKSLYGYTYTIMRSYGYEIN